MIHDRNNLMFKLVGLAIGLLMMAFIAFGLVAEMSFKLLLVVALPVLSVGLMASYWLAHHINCEIGSIYQAIDKLALTAEDIASGDFDKRLANNDIQTVAIAEVFNAFVDRIANVVRRVTQNANNVIQASEKLKNSSSLIADSANDVECRLALTATSSEHIAFNANTMAIAIEEASGNVSTVSASVYELSTNINTVAASAEQASTNMVGINHSFDRISQDINTVANSAEKMSVSMSEIAKNAQNAMRISADATASAQKTLATMNQLSETAKKNRARRQID